MTALPNTLLSSLPDNFRAVVLGSNGGIGSAVCDHIRSTERLGDLIELSRSRHGFDITDERSVGGHAAGLAGKPIHLLVCATGVLIVKGRAPEKALRDIDPETMIALFRANAIGPALVAKHFMPLLPRRDRSIAAFLSARVGSIGDNRLGGWISYRSSKAALNQIVRTAAIELGRTHPQAVVAAVHPGTVRTELSAPYAGGHRTSSPDEAAAAILHSLDRLPASRSGSFVAYDGTDIEW